MGLSKIFNQRITRRLILIFYSLGIITQLLVLLKIIPYTWVNGGMSKSYGDQAVISLISLFILSLLLVFVWRVSTICEMLKTWQRFLLYGITVFWAVGFMLQLIGTPFERFVLSVVMLLGLVSHLIFIRMLGKAR